MKPIIAWLTTACLAGTYTLACADLASLERDIQSLREQEAKLTKLRTGIQEGKIVPTGTSKEDWKFRTTDDLREDYISNAILTELILAEKNKTSPNIPAAEQVATKRLNQYLSSIRPRSIEASEDLANRIVLVRTARQKLQIQLDEKRSQQSKSGVSFHGDWDSFVAAPFRIPIELTLTQTGNSVTGNYRMEGKYVPSGKDVVGTLKGMIDSKGQYQFEWKDNFGAFGKGVFRLTNNGTEIRGMFGSGEAKPSRLWNATRKKT